MLSSRQIIGMGLIAATLLGVIYGLMNLALISGQIEIFVSPDGNDSWSGRSPEAGQGRDGPFATIDRARREVGNLIADGLERDVVVWIRDGIYYAPWGLTFGPEDSGTDSCSVTYASYPGEDASIVGGMVVTGWEAGADGQWKAPIPGGVETTQLFEDGRRMELARSPNYGYFDMEGPAPGRETEAFVYKDGDIDPAGWDITGGRVFHWPGYDWYSAERGIVSIDADTRTVTMDGDGSYPMVEGNRYFVRNVLELLDIPGECHIDLEKGVLSCLPYEEPLRDNLMVISTAWNVISLVGEEGRPVRNLHFENLSLGICNGDVFLARGVEDCTIKYCRIENGGQSGVLLSQHAQRVRVYGNLIRFNGLHGVSLMGLQVGGDDVNHHNVVENNHIHHCGELVGHGYGVRISQSGHNQVIHNHIHDMPRYGTSIKGMYFPWMVDQLEGVTWENHYDYLHSRDNLLAYNHIHHVNLDSQDTGAMESWSPGRDNVYDHNLVHDTGNSKFTYQKGIYLDGGTDYLTITNNIIYGVTGAGSDACISANGVGNIIANNIMVVEEGNFAAVHSIELGEDRTRDHEYTRNIYVFESSESDVFFFTFWNDERVAESDYNLYYKPEGELTIGGGHEPVDGPFEDWLNLFGGKFDQNSVIADPQFVDLAGRDFRLKPGSPALELGFEEIDVSEIGLGEDFPLHLAESVEEQYRIPPGLIHR